jgi:hypothetical protein
MMSHQYVKPFVKTNKNDRNDAQVISEAATPPIMNFVPGKTLAAHLLSVLQHPPSHRPLDYHTPDEEYFGAGAAIFAA